MSLSKSEDIVMGLLNILSLFVLNKLPKQMEVCTF
jgi:hypothetical protein